MCIRDSYNELCDLGKDLDFGKEAKWLTAIDTPPFYGIHRHVRVSAVVSGVNVGPNMDCLLYTSPACCTQPTRPIAR